MKLKHLTLRGFKSFADRTRLDFSTGVNVVVGPNGSGKSNILDAIAWVMGTQATKSLRTEKMEDVVFAGTATRPSLSRAEVQLTFANDEQLMPLDLAEITVTRRLFRDGSSEYELNGAPCRLLDIQELLSDGGIGRQQHVLVGQGQVGEVLNARPEDHRAVIEEAAGVTKHRGRRDRAVRRLERTDHDIERLNDILSQQKKALRPLKRQANAAERYDSVRAEAKSIRLYLGGEELRSIRGRLRTAAIEREAARETRDSADAALEGLKDDLERLRAAAGEVGAALNRDTSAAARLETVRERLVRISNVAKERSRSIQSRLDGADERRDDLSAEEADLTRAVAETTEQEVAAVAEAERRETALAEFEDEERSLAEQAQLPAEGVIASLRGDLRALETSARRDAAEEEQVKTRLGIVAERIAEETAEIARLDELIRARDGQTTEFQATYTGLKENREARQVEWESRSLEHDEAKLVVARAVAKVEALEAAMEGLVDPRAREIADGSSGISGSVVGALDVPEHLAAAVDAALGVWGDAYVASSHNAIEDVAAGLKAEASGGVAFAIVSDTATSIAQSVAEEFGVERLVDALGAKADSTVAESFLGGVLLVEGWKSAAKIVAANPQITAVTPEGDVVSVDGMIVAHPDGAGPAALEAASVSAEQAETELAKAVSLRTGSQRTFDAARADERSALEQLESVEAELAGYTEALGLVDRTRAASHAESERLQERLSALAEARDARDVRIEGVRDRVAEFEGEEAARQAAWEALNARRERVADQRDAARRSVESIAARRASIAERKRLSEQRLEVVVAELQQLTLLPASAELTDRLGAIERAAEAAIITVASHIDSLRERQRALREESGTTTSDLVEAESSRERLDLERRTSADALAKLDVELAELRVRLEASGEALRRDVDADEDEALAAPKPELAEDVDLAERLVALEADIRRMGPINPLAAQEHRDLAAEVEELEKQMADLASSRDDVKKVIAALDEKMVTLFEEAFGEIAEFYHENFSLVFPGGSGRLSLTDPDDPLSTGVLVEAQPAGKKVGRLSLLSGGERSLAALAFLFAVFRARPSPFYVLDEVEAALDDANLHRFLRLVDTLRTNTQLVIITHQQQTMEAADVLYGVTMEPGESSKVLSKRMSPVTV
ncbi:MAG: chromosome segregation protein SMC [Acidimicrobiia bacterium]